MIGSARNGFHLASGRQYAGVKRRIRRLYAELMRSNEKNSGSSDCAMNGYSEASRFVAKGENLPMA